MINGEGLWESCSNYLILGMAFEHGMTVWGLRHTAALVLDFYDQWFNVDSNIPRNLPWLDFLFFIFKSSNNQTHSKAIEAASKLNMDI